MKTLYKGGETNRLDFSSLSNHALSRADIRHRAPQTATCFLDASHHDKHARLASNPLQLLSRSIASSFAALFIPRQLPTHPSQSGSRAALANGIPQINSLFKVLSKRLSAFSRAASHNGAKGRVARVAADESLWQEEDVDAPVCGATGNAFEVGEGEFSGGLSVG